MVAKGMNNVAIFSREEYEGRVRAAKQHMEQKGLDTLIVTDPANINYLTGYDGWSFYVPQAIIVSPMLTEPVWVGREQDAFGARLTCWMSENAFKPYADYYVQSEVRHPMDYVAQVIQSYRLDQGHLGVEMDAYYFSALSFQRLLQALPEARFHDATLLVNWIRLIKSDQEIRLIKQAANIVTRAMDTAMEVIRAGVRESDAAAEVLRAQIQGTEEVGGDYPAIVPLMPSQVRTGAARWLQRVRSRDRAACNGRGRRARPQSQT
jgi:Xaa-Pro dipeptidase